MTVTTTKALKSFTDSIETVSSAIRKEMPIENKKIEKFKYKEFGEPFSRISSS